MRAVAAVEANNVEKRVAELNRALNIFSELEGTRNFEKGGEVARHLEKFYMVMRSQVLEASIKNSKPLLLELIAHVGSLKEAWEQVDRQQGTNGSMGLSGSAIPVVPPQNARPAVAAVRLMGGMMTATDISAFCRGPAPPEFVRAAPEIE